MTVLDTDILVHLAAAFDNPLVLLVSVMPRLSKQHSFAAQAAQAESCLVHCIMSD